MIVVLFSGPMLLQGRSKLIEEVIYIYIYYSSIIVFHRYCTLVERSCLPAR